MLESINLSPLLILQCFKYIILMHYFCGQNNEKFVQTLRGLIDNQGLVFNFRLIDN